MPGLDVATARLVPVAGPGGWLARVAHAVLYSADATEEQLRELLDACEGGSSSAEVLGRVVALLSGDASPTRPPFALVTTAGPNAVVLVHGDQTVGLEDADGQRTELSSAAGAWLTRSLPVTARVTLGHGETDTSAGLTDLRAGVIPAAGAVLLAPAEAALEPAMATGEPSAALQAAPEAAPAPVPEPAPPVAVAPIEMEPEPEEPVADDDAYPGVAAAAAGPDPGARSAAAAGLVAGRPEVQLFDAAEEGALDAGGASPPVEEPVAAMGRSAPSGYPEGGYDPGLAGTELQSPETIPPGAAEGPMVAGRFCSRQHLNDPREQFCRICGVPLHPESTPEVMAVRPPLGVLVWDSGDSDPVVGDLIVGRDPAGDPEVAAGQVDGLTPSGHSEGMSRVHAELRLNGWDVTLADRGSTNGTFVWEEDRQAWHRLEPGERAPIKIGSIIAFGERTATFELPNVPG